MRKILLLPLFLLCLVFTVFSADVDWSDRISGAGILASTKLAITDGDLRAGNISNVKDMYQMGYIQFGFNEQELMNTMPDNISYTFSIELKVTPTDIDGVVQDDYTTTLNIEYSHQGGLIRDFNEQLLAGIYKFKVEVTKLFVNGVVVTTFPLQQIYLEIGLRANRYYRFDESAIPSTEFASINGLGATEIVTNNIVATIPATTDIEISWGHISGAEHYDLEWTWVDNYGDLIAPFGSNPVPLLPGEVDMSELEFKNNSTRVRTSFNAYRIPNVYARGYLICRVRGVGKWFEDLSKDKPGRWSSDNGIEKNTLADWPSVLLITKAHSQDLNWQFQSTYAEDGKRKELVSYFDGSLRERQKVTRLTSDKQALVGETVYDNEGRAVIQILPSPTKKNVLEFYPSFNQSEGNASKPYTHLDFDWESITETNCSVAASNGLDVSSGASNYYSILHSEDNWQRFVPSAEGYAFTQVEYTPDNTGRIRRQSGVGANYNIGSGHETEYYYAQPTQNELNRIFGYDVGFKQRYKKNMVIDGNEQVSVSYLDPQGRVVATALAGSNNTPFDDLYNPYTQTAMSNDFLNKLLDSDVNTPDDDNQFYSSGIFKELNDVLSVTTQMAVVEDGVPYAFEYEFISGTYEEANDCGGSELSFDFQYDVDILLKDDCGTEVIGFSENQLTNLTQTFNVALDKGTYTLSKYIGLNEQKFNDDLEVYLSDLNPCYKDITEFESTLESNCDISCAECEADLGTLAAYQADHSELEAEFANQAEQNTFYQKEYEAFLEACRAPCRITTSCNTVDQLLMMDMSPGGQYGNIIDANDPLSVFNLGNSLAGSSTPDWQHPFTPYLDASSNLSYVLVHYDGSTFSPAIRSSSPANTAVSAGESQDINVAPEDLLNLEDFLNNWEGSWSRSLIAFHPEYELYQVRIPLCNEKLSVGSYQDNLSSDEFDYLLRGSITDYNAARNQGATGNPFGLNLLADAKVIMDKDPFFNISYADYNHSGINYNTLKRNLMIEAIGTNFDGHGINLLEFAVRVVMCGSDLGNNCSTGISTYTWSAVSSSSLSASQKDAVWVQYMNNYLGYKQKIIQLMEDYKGYSQGINLYNGCIGEDNYSSGIVMAFQGSTYEQTIYNYYLRLEHPHFSGATRALGLCGSLFQDKVSRISRADGFYNPNNDPNTEINEMGDKAGQALWESTGLCPITLDVESVLNGMAKRDQFRATLPTAQYNVNAIPEFGDRLYSHMLTASGASRVNGNITANTTTLSGNLVTTFTNDNLPVGSQEIGSITLEGFNSLSRPSWNWTNYGSTWEIFGVSGSFPDPANTNRSQLIVLGYDLQDTVEVVVNCLASFAMNSCQVDFANNSLNSPDCNRKSEFEKDILHILQNSEFNGQFNSASAGYSPFSDAVLNNREFLNHYAYQDRNAPSFVVNNFNVSNTLNVETSLSSDNGCSISTFFNASLSSFSGLNIINVQNVHVEYDPSSNLPDQLVITAMVGNFNSPTVSTFTAQINYSRTQTCSGQTTGVEKMDFNCECVGASGLTNVYSPTTWDINHGYQSKVSTLDQLHDWLVMRFSNRILENSYVNNSVLPAGYSAPELIALSQIFYGNQPITYTPKYTNKPHIGTSSGAPVTHGYPVVDRAYFPSTIGCNENDGDATDPYVDDGLEEVVDLPVVMPVSTGGSVQQNSEISLGFDLSYGPGDAQKCTYGIGIFGNYAYRLINNPNYNGSEGNFVQITEFEKVLILNTNTEKVYTTFTSYDDVNETNTREFYSSEHGDATTGFTCSQGNPDGFVNCSYEAVTCTECVVELDPPLSCNDNYGDYIAVQNSLGVHPDEILTENQFCQSKLVYVLEAYQYYLQGLAITGSDDIHYLTIGEFGNTPIGYSNTKLTSTVNEFIAAQAATQDLLWRDFVTEAYMESRNLCPAQGRQIDMKGIEPDPDPCGQLTDNANYANTLSLFTQYRDNLKEMFTRNYVDQAMSKLVETFKETHQDNEQQYTLYYYDRAGNLTQTVPPAGVKRFDGSDAALMAQINNERKNSPGSTSTSLKPGHDTKTIYNYNSLNQLVYQKTTDGGESRFAYDALGRLILSQNAKQKAENAYSYTIYDYLGRVTEVGQINNVTGYTINALGQFRTSSNGFVDVGSASFPSNISNNRTQITRSFYSSFDGLIVPNTSPLGAASQFKDYAVNNSRNRIVATAYFETLPTGNAGYESAYLYDYDIHGNVKELVQIIAHPDLMDVKQHVKSVEYRYDLVSGNVNEIIFQRGKKDEFRHKYCYDSDNRITNAFTSTNGVNYEQDAKYFYYEHGPLARTEIGDKKVQAMQYAYTIQGWLKSVNGEQVEQGLTMGREGQIGHKNQFIGQGAFAYSLNYHDNDYLSSDPTALTVSPVAQATLAQEGLYNGNIRSMYTAQKDLTEANLTNHGYYYSYDQLNRLSEMKSIDIETIGASGTNDGYFGEQLTYDLNGNIESLNRKWNNTTIDQLTYNYDDANNKRNRLLSVDDAISSNHTDLSGNPIDDLKDQGTTNYQYDEIGQLTKDVAEGIENIDWNVANKVVGISRSSGSPLPGMEFDYGPMGNRISKKLIVGNKYTTNTYYFRDAQGNILATYDVDRVINGSVTTKTVRLTQRDIYGSSRIGTERPNLFMGSAQTGGTTGPYEDPDDQVSLLLKPIDKLLSNLGYESIKDQIDDAEVLARNLLTNIIELPNIKLEPVSLPFYSYVPIKGDKNYELSNHLGNVMNVITDRKLVATAATAPMAASYVPDVVSHSDYYPFGMQMPDRIGNETNYRYGYQGSEKDDEIKGEGNSYTTEYRQLDPRLGRWLSLDPVVKVWQSPYVSMRNNPITFLDPKGDDEYYNYKGQYLGSDDAETTTPRLIKQSDWNVAMKAIPEDDNPFNNDTPSSKLLVPKSKEIKFQSVADQQKVMRTLETKTASEGKEAAGIITLNTETATISVEEDLTAARFAQKVEWKWAAKQDDPTTVYTTNGKFNKIIIGYLHTHPQEEGKDTHGPSTPTNTAHPGSSDTQTSQTRKIDSYVLDNGLYRATPSGETEKLNNNTNIAKSALETYGQTHPAPQ